MCETKATPEKQFSSVTNDASIPVWSHNETNYVTPVKKSKKEYNEISSPLKYILSKKIPIKCDIILPIN